MIIVHHFLCHHPKIHPLPSSLLMCVQEVLAMDYEAPPYDIWRAGCVLYEFALGVPMFDVEKWAVIRERHQRAKNYSDDAVHLMDMQGHLGNLPREVGRM